jgi:hypothetical protein
MGWLCWRREAVKMTETERPRAGYFAAVSVVLAVLAMVGAGDALLVARVAGSVLPSARGGLWVGVQLWRVVPAALVFSVAAVMGSALAQRRSRGEVSLRRTARVAGTLGWISFFCVMLTAMLAPVLVRGPGSGREVLCSSSLESVTTALAMYSEDWGRQPPAGKWSDATRIALPEGYECPESHAPCGYARNEVLADLPASEVTEPARTVMLFESDRGWNAEGGPELLPDFPRHYYGDHIAFADGRVKWYQRKAPRGGVRWDTKWPREYVKGERAAWRPVVKGEGQ